MSSAAPPTEAPRQAPDPAEQRAKQARNAGYPTKKSQAELDDAITRFTAKLAKSSTRGNVDLAAPAPFVFDGVDGSCYAIVMRLADGAVWGHGAEAGLEFSVMRQDGLVSSGPGVVGPGAIASVGCADASGPITLSMAPSYGHDPIGTGMLELEVWSHAQTRAEREARAEEQERQQEDADRRLAAIRERQANLQEDRRSRRAIREGRFDPRARRSYERGYSEPERVSVTIRSACRSTVPVFYGTRPKYGSGTQSSISSNSVSSKMFRAGDMIWLTDDSGGGLTSVTIAPGMSTIHIDSSCTQIYGR